MPRPMNTEACRLTNGPRPMSSERAAKMTAIEMPAPVTCGRTTGGSGRTSRARRSRCRPSVSATPSATRLAGNIQSTASKTQMAAQTASALDEPSRLRPAADEANPTPGSSSAVSDLGGYEDGEDDVEADGARRAGQR